MKKTILIISILISGYSYSQDFKNDISVVQFSASFVKSAEMPLKPFNDYNIHSFYIEKNGDIFKNEKIKYLPTIILYHNGDEVIRIESGLDLKLPENCDKEINRHIEELLKDKF